MIKIVFQFHGSPVQQEIVFPNRNLYDLWIAHFQESLLFSSVKEVFH